MNILKLLAHNLEQGSRTRPPDEAVPYPPGYRGQLHHELALCTACGACAYSCSPGAITLTPTTEQVTLWRYFEDRCTFCGFCVDYCPTQALAFAAVAPETLTERSQHYLSHPIEAQPCPGCGQPVRPLPPATLLRLYGPALPPATLALCDRCRQRATSRHFRDALQGKEDTHA